MESVEAPRRLPTDRRERALIEAVAGLLAADMAEGELFAALCQLLPRFVDASVAFIALRDGAELRMRYVYDHGSGRSADDLLRHRSRSWEVLRSGRTQVFRSDHDWTGIERFPLNPDRPETDDSVSAVYVPLSAGGERLGVLSIQSTSPDAYDAGDVTQLEAIARYLAIAVRNGRLFTQLRRLVDRDPLTGLANHSTLLRTIDERVAAGDGLTGVIQLDVTGFGMINDVYGARAGDRVLEMVAARLESFEGAGTTVGRFGGDDFVVVAARRERAAIAALVDELAAATAGIALERGDVVVPVPVNIGWATAPDEATTRSALIALADMRLRLSLQQGGTPVGGDVTDVRTFGVVHGIEALVESALTRDPYTRMHLVHVNRLAHTWAERLPFDAGEREVFRVAALLHDVGKLLIPDQILLKPARLTPQEYAAMQRHAEYGDFLLRGYPRYAGVARIIGQHHERIDGRGYPAGLREDRIDRVARAVSIVDAYSAMVLDRPYHRASDEPAALAELERCAGTQFDAGLVASFVELRRSS